MWLQFYLNVTHNWGVTLDLIWGSRLQRLGTFRRIASSLLEMIEEKA